MLSLLSAAVYGLLAFLVFYFFRDTGLLSAFEHGCPPLVQLAIGGFTGGVASLVIWLVVIRSPVRKVLDDFHLIQAISRASFTPFDRIQLSLFAGAGEELLFRGALQPLLGIAATSVIFVGLHGYFKFSSPAHLLFGAVMFGLSVGLGYLFEQAGLLAAMSAHAVYDMLMLYAIQHRQSGA